MEQRDGDVGDQGVEDTIQGVEDKLQDEKGDSEGQDDQNSRKDLCPEDVSIIFFVMCSMVVIQESFSDLPPQPPLFQVRDGRVLPIYLS